VVLANGFMLSRKYYYSSQYMREPGRRVDVGVGGGVGLGGGGGVEFFNSLHRLRFFLFLILHLLLFFPSLCYFYRATVTSFRNIS